MALKANRLQNRADQMIREQEEKGNAENKNVEPVNSADVIINEIKNLNSSNQDSMENPSDRHTENTTESKSMAQLEDHIETPIKPNSPKKQQGRPKTKSKNTELRHIHLLLTEEMYNNIQIAKVKYGSNVTFYIETLVREDLKKNMKSYLELNEMIIKNK